jgi:hypothetical protein
MFTYNESTKSFDSATESISLYEIEPSLMYSLVRNSAISVADFERWLQHCQDAYIAFKAS